MVDRDACPLMVPRDRAQQPDEAISRRTADEFALSVLGVRGRVRLNLALKFTAACRLAVPPRVRDCASNCLSIQYRLSAVPLYVSGIRASRAMPRAETCSTIRPRNQI